MDIVFLYDKKIGERLDVFDYVLIKGKDGFFEGEKILTILKAPKREELKKNIDIVYGFEESNRKDFIHHRNSGMNHVLAKILHEKDIIVAFSFNSFLSGKDVIGRMRQNVKLCRKYKVKRVFASFATSPYEMRSLEDLKSFARVIGMNSSEIKRSSSILKDRIERNRKKRAGKLPVDGVEILNK